MAKISKIIVHDGIFHADDVMAVALLHRFVDAIIPVERTRTISQEDIANPEVWIVDVGGQYNKDLNNYDHHQDRTLPAACMLILLILHERGYINDEMRDELFDPIWHISDIDCNGPAGKDSFHVNALLKSFNALENGFDIALSVCKQYIQACKATVGMAVTSKQIWDEGEKVSLYIRVCNAFPLHWKRYDEQMFLIYPNAGKWTVLTRESEAFPLVKTGKEEFMHVNRFIATYKTKDDAIQCGQMSAINAVG